MPHFIFVLNILNMLYNLHFFSSKCRLFHNATLFGFCITHILNTGVLKFEKKSVAKRLNIPSAVQFFYYEDVTLLSSVFIFPYVVYTVAGCGFQLL